MFPKNGGILQRILKGIFSFVFTGIFIAIETFLFTAVLKKIQNFKNAPTTFTLLFLIIISLMMIIASVFKAKKLFFNELDMQQLANHPIDNSKQILSKLIFLFLTHYLSTLLFTFPIFAAYGVLYNKTMWFFYLAVFYPVLSSIFELGVVMWVVYPVWMFLEFVKKRIWLEFSLAVVLLLGLTYPYSQILNVFIGLVANNELVLIFTEESMATLTNVVSHALPINLLVNALLTGNSRNFFPYIAMSSGVFIIGLSITIFTFHYVRNMVTSSKPKKEREVRIPKTQILGLIKKEIILLTKNADYIFSYTGLLIVQPFLMYLVIAAMNTIFQSGSFLHYTVLFPGFVSLIDIFFIMMITIVINSGANSYISMEERTIKNLKTMPVDYRIQLGIKMLIPFSLSTASLIISLLVLLISGILEPVTVIFAFLLSMLLMLLFDFASMREELHIRHGKPRSTFISTVISYVLPFAYVAVSMLLSYNSLPIWAICSMGMVLFIILGLPIIFGIKKHMGEWFMDLEAIN